MPLAFLHFLEKTTCGTDHRFSWSVTQGLRPAKFHENLRRQEAVNLRSIFAFPSSLVFKGLRCFFDPVVTAKTKIAFGRAIGNIRQKAIVCSTSGPDLNQWVTDDKRRSSVPPLD